MDDIPANRNLLREVLEPHGYEVLMASDGETAFKVAQRTRPDVILLDVIMPGLDGFETCRRLREHGSTRPIPVIFITARDETKAVVEGFRAGGVDYVTRPFQAEEVVARVHTHLENSRLARALAAQNEELERTNARLLQETHRREKAEQSLEQVDHQLSLISQQEARRWGVEALVGRSAAMARIIDDVRKLRSLPTTSVLITGESGTGKELVARAIHFGSARARAPFLPVNCSAVPNDLAESLFFGHVKGAFSSAACEEKGYLQNAHGGTLFLDEIGDMPLPLQAKLLRVLESSTVLPLGAASERPVDVRILAATNSDLQADLAAGKFRQDLYFRLAHFVLTVPALREHREDVPLLAGHFLQSLAAEMGMTPPTLSAAALASLEQHDYPGNVRELRKLVERALIESGGGEIQPAHLHFVLSPRVPTSGATGGPGRDSTACRGVGENRPPAPTEDDRILAYVKAHESINNTQCRELLGVGMHRAWYLLRRLHRAGVLKQDSSGRWARYHLP
ncbi:MAG: sigma-54 dependent transcriptional regulator [Verrucomicrobia bacterium]|nr:sigma-54 dependent transcriptional regulator [Verrucomicrobiota bacterium]